MLDLTYDPTRYIVDPNESRWIVLTSSLFVLPGLYGYYNELYNVFYVLLATSLISINYWRSPRYSCERMLDLTFAKISAILFAINGIMNVRHFYGYQCLFLMLYCYYKSTNSSNSEWVKYHAAFHFFTICGQFFVIHAILKNKEESQGKCFYLC